ncbi:hypothetical protein PAXRUDRAFT_19529 [Paxillus rubicundulus Ve08.2h10]|uniref:Uncharacterized protein n=1 Tax=Paxillus rubicundulus Ve08.2h10 TaxID=930991 RepID=A0A0D0CHW8_9AGAM|nr:hypothetical protein PAXRUDRAFT_19529 [Paxillus rubicundulus Ve08.2h10]
MPQIWWEVIGAKQQTEKLKMQERLMETIFLSTCKTGLRPTSRIVKPFCCQI